VLLDVTCRRAEQDRVVLERSEADVARVAQVISELAGHMIVVNMQVPVIRWQRTAQRAHLRPESGPLLILTPHNIKPVKAPHIAPEIKELPVIQIGSPVKAAPLVLYRLALWSHVGPALCLDVAGALQQALTRAGNLVIPDRLKRGTFPQALRILADPRPHTCFNADTSGVMRQLGPAFNATGTDTRTLLLELFAAHFTYCRPSPIVTSRHLHGPFP
jgi:hypothetical protein